MYYLVVRQGPMRGRVMSCRRFAGLRREAAVAAEDLERRLNGGVRAAEAARASLARATQGGHMAGLARAEARLRFVSVLTPAMAAQLPKVQIGRPGAPATPRARPALFKTAGEVLQDLGKHQGDRRLRIARR